MDLNGQHILVTGASRGIGAAIARHLMASGARLVVHYNRNRAGAEALLEEFPGSASVALGANLELPREVSELFNRSLQELGHLDSVVLNAGVFLPHPPGSDLAEWWKIWRTTLAVNLDAAGILTKLALDHFMERSGGRLLYIGSRAAFRGETDAFLAYAASKGGLTSLSRSVARSYGRYNIKAFTIAPGFTRTEMAETFIREKGEKPLLEEIALPALTIPEDIAPLATFICSGQMDHATGTTIDMNAGSYMH
ncbi:SDR family NAD(P)-dependent oxidoreductase [Robiginitalea sp. SC105]|uniref:SDR family NAD(P)-dependent oxidoreductase n=1 Tax=Robiginitalea sp. SC105 TaxID=2762332 RepID=UPI00163955C2|nr:SDR family oxidoreductase [Robiginitalea sp. SC105]MBC2840552.1 SDR family oxidoreductase [Robiginitalea sp. SC105]